MDQLYYCIAEEIRVLAVVEPEAHFVEVGREMLRGDFMPRPHNVLLDEKRESRFHGAKARRATLSLTDFVTLVPNEIFSPDRAKRSRPANLAVCGEQR